MTRPARHDEPGGLYHVKNRAVGRRPMFESTRDTRKFLARLACIVRRGMLRVVAYSVLLDAIISNVDWKPAGVALQSALGELWAGLTAEGIWEPFFSALVSDVYFQHSSQEIVAVMLSIMLETLRNNPVDRFFDSAKEIGLSILEGIKAGFMKGMDTITEWIGVQVDDFVQDWKDFLGIASPSTVFMGIGINIVQGLMLGIASMWSILSMFVSTLVGTLVNTFKTLVSTLMDIFSGVVTAYTTSRLAGVLNT